MRAGPPAPQLVDDRALVRRIAVRMEQAHRHCVGVDVRQRVEIERLELPVRAHAPAHSVGAFERDERLGPGRARAVQMRTRLPA